MSSPTASLPPGFRFHPTDEELILHYLRNRAASRPCPVSIIADVDIYKFDPWDLPAKAMFGEREWYFFTPRERKYPNGVRPNRAAASGYWKATGTDKPILAAGKENKSIGVKKALVFYRGKPPKGRKTDWIMHEYRLAGAQLRLDSNSKPIKFRDYSMRLDDWVLCRIYKKCSHLPVVDLEQEDSGGENVYFPGLQPSTTTLQNSLMLHKSSSLSDLLDTFDYSLLSQLLEDPTELLGIEQGRIATTSTYKPFVCGSDKNGNNFLTQEIHQTGSAVSAAESYLKRQKVEDDISGEDGGFMHPLKKQSSSCFVSNYTNNQADNRHNSLLNQPYFNQQRLMNFQFGLH